ncbi:MAG: BspA family leucine-rich repeat surface protein [Lachnospiraceae bacterium]|nr:BspA family leucine-rich repeat surface protein [Lachnospiraceae bacterium]
MPLTIGLGPVSASGGGGGGANQGQTIFDLDFVTTTATAKVADRNITEFPMVDTSKVTDMTRMFENCQSLQSIPKLDTSKVISMMYMFSVCKKLQSIPLLDTSNVTDMSLMFNNCASLLECELKGLKTTLSFKDSPLLSKESVLYIFENAQTVTTSQTITLHADVFAQLTEDEIAIATEKGFSVVSA